MNFQQQLLNDPQLNKKYNFVQKIGEGCFGKIYKVKNKQLKIYTALKIQFDFTYQSNNHNFINDNTHIFKKNKLSLLQNQAKILLILQGKRYVPTMYSYGKWNYGRYIQIQLLDHDLTQYVPPSFKFKKSQIIILTIQLLHSLYSLHSCNVIHQDIKPQNIMVNKKRQYIFIDFGISNIFPTIPLNNNNKINEIKQITKKQLDQKSKSRTNSQINNKNSKQKINSKDKKSNKKSIESNKKNKINLIAPNVKGFIGTPRYSSVQAHRNLLQSKKDDIQSLLYLIAYIYLKSLPWMHLKVHDQRQKIQLIKYVKIKTTNEIFSAMGRQFLTLFEYVKKLKFAQQPNYRYMINLIKPNRSMILLNININNNQQQVINQNLKKIEEKNICNQVVNNKQNQQKKINQKRNNNKKLSLNLGNNMFHQFDQFDQIKEDNQNQNQLTENQRQMIQQIQNQQKINNQFIQKNKQFKQRHFKQNKDKKLLENDKNKAYGKEKQNEDKQKEKQKQNNKIFLKLEPKTLKRNTFLSISTNGSLTNKTRIQNAQYLLSKEKINNQIKMFNQLNQFDQFIQQKRITEQSSIKQEEQSFGSMKKIQKKNIKQLKKIVILQNQKARQKKDENTFYAQKSFEINQYCSINNINKFLIPIKMKNPFN